MRNKAENIHSKCENEFFPKDAKSEVPSLSKIGQD